MFLLLVFQAFQNSFSHIEQSKFSLEVKRVLSKENIEIEKLTYFNNFSNIFYLRSKDKGVERITTNVSVQNFSYYGGGKIYDVLEIYSVYTTKDFRRMGLAKKILYRAIRKASEMFKLVCPILTLHLNVEDAMMHVAFSFYINIGFHTLCYVETGPSDMKFSMDEKDKFFKWEDVLKRPVEGKHLALFAFNGFNNDVNGDFTDIGKQVVNRIQDWISKKNDDSNENKEI